MLFSLQLRGAVTGVSALLLLLWVVLLLSCNGDYPPLINSFKVASNKDFRFYPAISDSLVILPVPFSEGRCGLKAINRYNGKSEWTLEDSSGILQLNNIYYNNEYKIYRKTLYLPIGNQLLAIDLKNGRIKWELKHQLNGVPVVSILDSMLVRAYNDNIHGVHEVLFINSRNGNIESKVKFEKKGDYQRQLKTPFCIDSGDTNICLTSVIDYRPKAWTKSYLLRWEFSDEKNIVKKIIYPENIYGLGVNQSPVVDFPFFFYCVHDTIKKIDIRSMSEVWKTPLNSIILTSRLLGDASTLYGATENKFILAIDKQNGNIIWTTKIGGTPSRIFAAAGDLWLISGSEGILYRIDKKSGAIIDQRKINGHSFKEGRFLRRTFSVDQNSIILNEGSFWYILPLENLGLVTK